MTGIELEIDGTLRKGGIQNGITSVIISYKNDQYSVFFNSLDGDTSMISYVWYSSNLNPRTTLSISLVDILEQLEPKEVIDYNNKEYADKRDLETYFNLKQELIKEGILKINE